MFDASGEAVTPQGTDASTGSSEPRPTSPRRHLANVLKKGLGTNAKLKSALDAGTALCTGPNISSARGYMQARAAHIAGLGLPACAVLDAELMFDSPTGKKKKKYTTKDLAYDLRNGYLGF